MVCVVTESFLEEGAWNSLPERQQSPGQRVGNDALVNLGRAGLGPRMPGFLAMFCGQ